MFNIFHYFKKFYLSFICTASIFASSSVTGLGHLQLPREHAVPGGVVFLEIKSNTSTLPKAYFNDQPVLVYQNNKKSFAMIGIPLNTKPGNYKIKYEYDHNVEYQDFKIDAGKYDISKITIKNKNMVNPDKKTLLTIAADQAKIQKALNSTRAVAPQMLVFQQPVKGILSTSFGAQRIINGQIKNPHSGMDIAAPTGEAVYSAGDGVVTLAENFYFSGNMIAVDHGSGLITLYAHLSKILVKVGDKVITSDMIGRVGSTGRVTGPHLHWTVKLNQASVNPALFITAG